MDIAFTKMHGIGNDYIYINGFIHDIDNPSSLACLMSDRHFGVGSDGLVLILPPTDDMKDYADVRMRMFNSDGSEAEMCGNASRCVGKYVVDNGLVQTTAANPQPIRLQTLAGIKIITPLFEDGKVVGATVDMGEPELVPSRIPVLVVDGDDDTRFIARTVNVAGTIRSVTAVSMGNPHAVVFVENTEKLDLPHIGSEFETHPIFPAKVNTEFVQIMDSAKVKMRVWERGAGETLACGTGACAVAVASVLTGKTGRAIDVELLGGTLHINWDAETNHVFMTGGAVTVFDGVFHTQ